MILLIFAATYTCAYVIYNLCSLAGLRISINLPVAERLAGLFIIAIGLVVGLDMMRYRRPLDVLTSTSDTFKKLLRRKPIDKVSSRTEPFIPKGPYQYVRNPMYITVLAFLFGLGISNSFTITLLWGLVQTFWFGLVEIPFEEKELQALLRESYANYNGKSPCFFRTGRSTSRTMLLSTDI